MNELIKYENGLRLIVGTNQSIRSVATGFWVGAGSAKETPQNNGISHFTEHMLFKGTKKMSPFDIANSFESLGAMVNAFTGKESTCFYVKSVDEYSEKCFDILSDIFLNSTFPAEELNKERKVIIEEINMVEDSPEDICYDLLANSLYSGTPIGQTILGSIENVKRFNSDDIRDYMSKVYTAENTVISMAGNVTLAQADALVKKYILPYMKASSGSGFICPRYDVKSNSLKRVKDFEQSNIAISYPSVKFNDSLFATQSILNLILGGGMSSRLFQKIREQMGLAYSVYTAPSTYINNGSFNILLNITAANTSKVLVAVKNEIQTILNGGITAEEFSRAKAQLKSASVFAMENVQTVMTSMGKLMVMSNEVYDMDKRIADIDNVTIKAVNDFTQNLFTKNNVCAAYVGKQNDTDILAAIKL